MAGTSSQDYFNQLNQYAADPNAPTTIENTIKKAYEGPVGQLINEGNQLRPQAYSGFFNAFNNMGTGAADMSPAAALSAAINQGELAMSPYRQNQGLRDYYGTSINDLVGKGMNAYQMGYGNLKDLYNMAFQREQADQQLALERARLRAAGGGGGGFNFGDLLNAVNGGSGVNGINGELAVNVPDQGNDFWGGLAGLNRRLNPTILGGYTGGALLSGQAKNAARQYLPQNVYSGLGNFYNQSGLNKYIKL